MNPTSFEADAARVPELKSVGLAIRDYIYEVYPSVSLSWNTNLKKWVAAPNFVTVKFQPRARSIRITVTGEPEKHPSVAEINLVKDQNSYSNFVITSPIQLPDAKIIISRACKLKLQ